MITISFLWKLERHPLRKFLFILCVKILYSAFWHSFSILFYFSYLYWRSCYNDPQVFVEAGAVPGSDVAMGGGKRWRNSWHISSQWPRVPHVVVVVWWRDLRSHGRMCWKEGKCCTSQQWITRGVTGVMCGEKCGQANRRVCGRSWEEGETKGRVRLVWRSRETWKGLALEYSSRKVATPTAGTVRSICLRNTQTCNGLGGDCRFGRGSPGRKRKESQQGDSHPQPSPLTSALSRGSVASSGSKPLVCWDGNYNPFLAKQNACTVSSSVFNFSFNWVWDRKQALSTVFQNHPLPHKIKCLHLLEKEKLQT